MAKILTIDDDPGILVIYREILKNAGFEVFFAQDPVGAINKYTEVRPDLIILDWEMPAGGGMAVFQRLRHHMLQPVPVLFVSAHPETKIGLPIKMHLVGYLKKPFTHTILVSKIKELLAAALPPQK
ncbi:MAG: response regulator [Elusimicrobia bacterium]|nr:response regulator [Elusimicrobiota bacterium]